MKDELIIYHKTTTLLAIPKNMISYFGAEPAGEKVELFAYQIVGAGTQKISLGKYNNTAAAKNHLVEWWLEMQSGSNRIIEA